MLWISPDLSTDQRTGASYYTMQIAIRPESTGTLDALRLVAGMTVEALVQTPARTILSFLTKQANVHEGISLRDNLRTQHEHERQTNE